MQEEVLKLILLSLEGRPVLSYKDLVHSVLLKEGASDPDGVKPIVKYIVHLLSIASCFQVNIQQKEMILSEVFVFKLGTTRWQFFINTP
jgi:hypothetical protein